MYLRNINQKYFSERQNEPINEFLKNPFDLFDNNYSDQHDYTKFRTNKNTTPMETDKSEMKTVLIDGIEIPANVNWNEKDNLNHVKD